MKAGSTEDTLEGIQAGSLLRQKSVLCNNFHSFKLVKHTRRIRGLCEDIMHKHFLPCLFIVALSLVR